MSALISPSVIALVTTFNRPKLLKARALKSIKNQKISKYSFYFYYDTIG